MLKKSTLLLILPVLLLLTILFQPLSKMLSSVFAPAHSTPAETAPAPVEYRLLDEPTSTISDTTTAETSLEDASSTEANVAVTTTPKVVLPKITLKVRWQKPVQIHNVTLFYSDRPAFKLDMDVSGYGPVKYYHVGNEIGKSTELIMGEFFYHSDETFGPSAHIFLTRTKKGKITILEKYTSADMNRDNSAPYADSAPDDQAGSMNGVLTDSFIADGGATRIPDLDFPATITGSRPRQVLAQQSIRPFDVNSIQFGLAPEHLIPAFIHKKLGTIFTSTSTGGFYLVRGPLVAVYTLQPDFYPKHSVPLDRYDINNTFDTNLNHGVLTAIPQITWNDNTANTNTYEYRANNGCLATSFLHIVNMSVKKDLVPAGKNSHGDTIYTLKDQTDKRLKDWFKDGYPGSNLTYKEFLTTKPLIFWIDPFGRLVELQNSLWTMPNPCI